MKSRGNIKNKQFVLKNYLVFFALLLMTFMACQKAYFHIPPPPKAAIQTSNLQAWYTSTPPLEVSSAFWQTANFIKVSVSNLDSHMLYKTGMENMTGTFHGISSYNKGKNPNLILKAAYDNNKIYIYAEWTDNSLSPLAANSLYQGPGDPLISPYPADTGHISAWTTQYNSDKLALAFDISGSTGPAGTFSQVGCAAACHYNGTSNVMQLTSGTMDIWSWDLATSEPLGYVNDLCEGTTGIKNDTGQVTAVRNKINLNDPTSGPAYEWDGTAQTFIRPDGKSVTLDPTIYLLNKTSYLGNPATGASVYLNAGASGCQDCHSYYGAGGPCPSCGGLNGPSFSQVGVYGSYSRAGMIAFASSATHPGQSTFVTVGEQTDLIAYIEGLSGLPGHYLQEPNGSCSDIWSESNFYAGAINIYNAHRTYQVVFVRDLTTGHADDIQFTSTVGKTYPFGIALMNADGLNHIGSLLQTLEFKPKQ